MSTILVEADFLVNLYEDDSSRSAAEQAYDKIFRTNTGKNRHTSLYSVLIIIIGGFTVMREEWTNFAGGKWESDIDVRDFIQKNYTPYDGDQSFLEGPTEATDKLWGELKELQKEERAKGGVLDMETEVVSGITAYGAAYLDKDLEKVVGLQTDKPLKRAFMPYGGIKMAEQSCQMYGYTPLNCLCSVLSRL